MRTPLVALVVVAGAALHGLAGCSVPVGPERAGAAAEVLGFLPNEPEVSLGSDPRFVLRQRLDPAAGTAPGGQDVVTSARGEPFSHRGRRWNVYPVTLYPNTRLQVRLDVGDPALADGAAFWVFGPMRHDGSWGPPRRLETALGTASATVTPAAYGQYAIVVGPSTPAGFARRYPSGLARLQDPDGAEVMAQISIGADGGAFLWTEAGQRWDIVAPLPANVAGHDPIVGDAFELADASGRRATFRLEAWSSSSWFMPELGAGYEDAVLGNLDGLGRGVLALNPTSDPADEQRFQVLDAIGADGEPSTSPAMLRVVPESSDGRAISVQATDRCDTAGCKVPIFTDDGTEVPDALVRTFKPTYYDFDETSTYDLALTWERRDPSRPAVAGIQDGADVAAGLTRYPVYFAHGFNSSEAVWTPVLEALRAGNSRWNQWATAGSVPGFEPVAARAEQMRRNLTAFLAGLSPAQGQTYQRVNVVAHSMGGLDARTLLGDPKYNERCGELLCTNAAGAAEACCPADTTGRPVPWRERIASVTTLSTPHCGSSFADLGVRLLDTHVVDWAFRKVAAGYFGLDEAGQQAMRQTFFALSRTYCSETMGPDYPEPNPARHYDWACATGAETCATPALAQSDRPVATAEGRHQLPGPAAAPTIFSWASLSCLTGTCGDVIDPGLLLPHLTVRHDEGDNDGVVSTQSARFGIFMGIRSNDHFHWNRTTYKKSNGFFARLFGVEREPIDRFHVYWLGELARAGY